MTAIAPEFSVRREKGLRLGRNPAMQHSDEGHLVSVWVDAKASKGDLQVLSNTNDQLLYLRGNTTACLFGDFAFSLFYVSISGIAVYGF